MDDLQVRAAATDIFSYLVEFSPSMVREFVMQEPQQTDDVSKVKSLWEPCMSNWGVDLTASHLLEQSRVVLLVDVSLDRIHH